APGGGRPRGGGCHDSGDALGHAWTRPQGRERRTSRVWAGWRLASPRLLCPSRTPLRQGGRVSTAETGGSASAASRRTRPTTACTRRHATPHVAGAATASLPERCAPPHARPRAPPAPPHRGGHALPGTRCGAPTHTEIAV